MLIVSQDRRRTSENMEISVVEIYGDETDEKIVGYSLENDYMELGKYATEGRCKEILEEIIQFYGEVDKGIFYMPQI